MIKNSTSNLLDQGLTNKSASSQSSKLLTNPARADKTSALPDSASENFSKVFQSAFNSVNDTVVHAENKMEQLASGQNKDIHGTMISMEKANISFKLLNTVRNKVVSAYQEISRMQI